MEISKYNNLLCARKEDIKKVLNKRINEEIYYIEEFKALKCIEEDFNEIFSADSKENINYMYQEYVKDKKERVMRGKNDWEIDELIDDCNELSSYFEYDSTDVIKDLEDAKEEMNKEDEIIEKEDFKLLESDISNEEIINMFKRLVE